MQLSVVFVAQGGPLEVQASLLAASLDRLGWEGLSLTAAIPSAPHDRPPSPHTLGFLRSLGVNLAPIRNPIAPDYPIGNKLACLVIPTPSDDLLFLDSDIVCLREPGARFWSPACQFAARPTDFADITAADWDEACQWLGQPKFELDQHSCISREPIPAYFNSGCVAVRDPIALYDRWVHFARLLNDKERLPFTRPFLDQISLSFALRELNWRLHHLEQIDHLTAPVFPIDALDLPFAAHYHETIHVLGDAFLASIVSQLKSEYAGLDEILSADPFLGCIPKATDS